jgi:hypothetical protein
MKKLLRRVMLVGAIVGGIYAVRSYLRGGSEAMDSVQMVFDDGSTRSLASNTTEGREFADIGRKIIEIGL